MGDFFNFLVFNSGEESHPNNLILHFSSCRCNLPRISVFSKPDQGSKIVTPKPLTVWGHVNERWKHGRILFDFDVQLMVGFRREQSRCNFPYYHSWSRWNCHSKPRDHFSSIISFYVFLHVSLVILHLSDGMIYFVVDGANSLRQEHVWWCPRVLNPSSWNISSTYASTFSTDISSEPRATVGTAECHRAKVGSNQWASGRTFKTTSITSTASRVLLPQLLGNTPYKVRRDNRPARN
jgi:hypothetical protein